MPRTDALTRAQTLGSRARGVFANVVQDLETANQIAEEVANEADRVIAAAESRRAAAVAEINQNVALALKLDDLLS